MSVWLRQKFRESILRSCRGLVMLRCLAGQKRLFKLIMRVHLVQFFEA